MKQIVMSQSYTVCSTYVQSDVKTGISQVVSKHFPDHTDVGYNAY